MKNDNASVSLVTLANATELAVALVLNVVGNDVSDCINGTPVGAAAISNIVQSRIQKNLKLV